MKTDLTGYPKADPAAHARASSPASSSVADGFDAATTRRSYQTVPIEPDQVLREMWENPKRGYDPLLVKALINLIGVYPVGTCVILDTFEIGVVAGAESGRPAAQPPAGPDRGRRERRRGPAPGTLVSLTERTNPAPSAAPSSKSPTRAATGSRSATTLSESRLRRPGPRSSARGAPP